MKKRNTFRTTATGYKGFHSTVYLNSPVFEELISNARRKYLEQAQWGRDVLTVFACPEFLPRMMLVAILLH
jgi:hypothetical protein